MSDINKISLSESFEHDTDITFITCWYELKCKFEPHVFYKWINNFLSTVKNHNLVIYSDENSSKYFTYYLRNPKIKLIIKPIEEFYNYKYKDQFIANHDKNIYLNNLVEWKVNMLWCEKVHFVYDTIQNNYFNTKYYGWCDIGYFRDWNNSRTDWPDPEKIAALNDDKIYYACVYYNDDRIKDLMDIVQSKDENGLPIVEIPPQQNSIAGGFFVSNKKNIEWWRNTFDEKLQLYFQHDYLVKDDQIIIVDCVFSNMDRFKLIKEDDINDSNWFLFQRYLA